MVKLKKNILAIIAEVKAIKKSELIYPEGPVENAENILGVMSLFELQLFTAIRKISLEHEKIHDRGGHTKKDNSYCIMYGAREQLLTSMLMDSVAQKIKSSQIFVINFRQGGLIEAVEKGLDPEEDLFFGKPSDFEKDQPGFFNTAKAEA